MAKDEPVLSGVSGRYASALFELARDEKKLADVERDLNIVSGWLGESEDLRRLVKSPVISADQQSAALVDLLQKAGADALTANFLKLIAKNRRLFVLPEIISAFLAMAAKSRGETVAEVVSAQPLNEAQIAALKEQLRSTAGREVRLNMSVDPALIGGLVVKVGSRMIDSSIRTKLSNMKVALKEAR